MTQSHQRHQPPLLNRRETYTSVTDAAYTAKAGDQVIGVNRAGPVAITLPSAEVRPGRIYTVKDESGAAASNNITVATEGSETIDGSATNVIATNYQGVAYYSDGANWFVAPKSGATHPEGHTAASHSDQGATGTELETLTDGSETALHSHANALAQATQSAIESETNEDSYIPPDLIKHAIGIAKTWALLDGDAATPATLAAYGVSSITDNNAGDYVFNWSTNFSSANYGVTTTSTNLSIAGIHDTNNPAAGSCRIRNTKHDGTENDVVIMGIAAFGDFA